MAANLSLVAEQQAADSALLVECKRWLWRLVHGGTLADRQQAATLLLDELAERFDDQPGQGVFATLTTWLGDGLDSGVEPSP